MSGARSAGAVGIVLGARVRADGSASPALKRRAQHGARLWHTGTVSHLILSGGPTRGPVSEAEVMAQICLREGVPAARLTQEPNATNSIENIRFSRRFLPENSAVILITDAYHAPRARLIARRLGLRATSASPRLGQVPRARLLKAWAREAAAYAWTALTLWR